MVCSRQVLSGSAFGVGAGGSPGSRPPGRRAGAAGLGRPDCAGRAEGAVGYPFNRKVSVKDRKAAGIERGPQVESACRVEEAQTPRTLGDLPPACSPVGVGDAGDWAAVCMVGAGQQVNPHPRPWATFEAHLEQHLRPPGLVGRARRGHGYLLGQGQPEQNHPAQCLHPKSINLPDSTGEVVTPSFTGQGLVDGPHVVHCGLGVHQAVAELAGLGRLVVGPGQLASQDAVGGLLEGHPNLQGG